MANSSNLVIDKDKPIALSIQSDFASSKLEAKLLSLNGFNVISTSSVKTGLELAANCNFDAVFTGIMLNENLSGLDLIDQLKNKDSHKETIFVAVTTQTDNDSRNNIVKHGFDYIIAKPIDLIRFKAVCEKIKNQTY
ncbi:MAG: response regulator [Candidatus Falkowbacteria bacterium]